MSALASGGTVAWLRRWLFAPSVPLAAVEVRARSLGAVRLRRVRERLAIEAAAALDLPEGCLVPGLEPPNVRDGGVFSATLQALVDRAGLAGGGGVALVVPDSAVRVRLVPRGELEGASGPGEMLRFRLRTTVPFEIRDAGLTWTPAAGGQVLAAVIDARVREEYESAGRVAGLDVGLLVPMTLALVEAPELRRPGDHLLVNHDHDAVSFVLLRDGEVLLYRSLSVEALGSTARVAREAATTLLYHRERLGGDGIAGLWLRAAGVRFDELAAALDEPTGLQPQPLAPWSPLTTTGGTELDALSGAVACLRGRAA